MRHSTFSHNLVFLSNFCTDLSSRFRAVLVPFSSHSRAIIEGKHVLKAAGRFVATFVLLFSLATGHAWGENATFTMSSIFDGTNTSASVISPVNASVSTTASAGNADDGKLGSDGNYFQIILSDYTFTAASINGYINTNSTDKNWAFQFSTDGGSTWGSELTQANDGTKSAHDITVGVAIPSGANGFRVIRRSGTTSYVYSITLTLASSCPSSVCTIYSAAVVATSTQTCVGNTTRTLTSVDAAITGGTLKFINNTGSSNNYIYYVGGGYYFFEPIGSSTSTVFWAELNTPLEAGDIITLDCQSSGASKSIWVTTTGVRPGSAPPCSGTVTSTGQCINYTVTAGSQYEGATELYFWATNNDTGFDNISITRLCVAAPTDLSVGSITATGATFTVTDGEDTNNYEFYYSTSSTTPAADATATATSTNKTKAITGLASGTTYYAWVRAVCDASHKSEWVALTGTTFSTPAAYTLTWNLDGGTVTAAGTAAGEVAVGTTLTAPTVAKDCYDFAGWTPAVPSTMPASNSTFTATWTPLYAIGTYIFDNTATVGSSPSKTVSTTATDYAAFRVDNLFFSAMKIQLETGTGGDGNNYVGWKIKTSGATIKFLVEDDSDVSVSLGTIGSASGKEPQITYTSSETNSSVTTTLTGGTINGPFHVKAGTMVTISTRDGNTVTLKKIIIAGACSNPVINSSATQTSFAGGSWTRNSGHTITVTATGADSYEWYYNTSANDAGAILLAETSNTLDVTTLTPGTYFFKAIAKSGACSSATEWGWCGAITITAPASTYYYRGDDNSWGATAMTVSAGNLYEYISSTTDAHQFKIALTTTSWDYDYNYVKAGYCMTNLTTIGDYNHDNCFIWDAPASYYIIVLKPNTILNSTNDPIICASTTLPDETLATKQTIYFVPNSNWLADGAKFAINGYGHNNDYWSDYMTQNTCDGSVYEVEIPAAYSHIIIVRLDPSGTKDWDGKWNQSGDLQIPLTMNCLTRANAEWNDFTTTWSAYTPSTYTITFDGNGNTGGTMTNVTGIPCNGSVTLASNGFTKTNNAFDGWNTADDGSGTPYADGATISSITSNITLYAQWTADCADRQTLSKVVLTSASAGTVSGYNNKEYAGAAKVSVQNSTSTADIDPSHAGDETGYKLGGNGQYVYATLAKGTFQIGDKIKIAITAPGGKGQLPIYYASTTSDQALLYTIDDASAAGTYEYTLTAADITTIGSKTWLGIYRTSSDYNPYVYSIEITGCRDWTTYSVTYNGNNSDGGSVPTDANEYLYGATVTVLGNTGTLTRSLYRFDGWNTAADGSGADFAASSTFTITKDTTLYAKWVPDCTDPVVTTQPSNYSMVHGGTALLACAADKGTYQWYNATDNTAAGTGAAGTPVSVGSGYNAGGWTTPTISTNGEYQYYCVITDGLCSVTTNTVTLSVTDPPTPATAIDINGATEIHPGQSTVLSVTYTPANANTDTVLTWTTSDPTIATVNQGTVTGVALGTVTITATTANGKSDTHTINVVPIVVTLNANGGSVVPDQLTYGGTPLVLPTPTRAGYACLGWYTASAGGTLVSSPYSPTASITLYAHWENTDLTLHTPGVYETIYGQTLKINDSKKYEVYGFTSTGSNVNYLWAGAPTTDETANNCLMKFAQQTEVTREWISQNMYGRGSSGSMSSAEFVASSVYAMNYRENYSLQIRVKGFVSFAIYAIDADADKSKNKYLKVEINGEDVTTNLSTSATIRRYTLDKNTEYLIKVKGLYSGSNVTLYGFSLQVPDCTLPTLEWATTPNETVVKETSATATVTTNYPAGVTYTSSDPSVMTVTGNGTTTASLNFLTAGTVTLTAQVTGDDGTYCNSPVYITKTFTVLNDPIPATAISLEDVAIEVGESLQLVPTWTPANATNAETSGYVTGSTDIATVTASGMLTGVAVGRTTVTVTSVSGLTATANVIVRPAAIPCETWEGTPAAWSGGQMTIGELVLTGSTTIETTKAYDNINATIINVDNKNIYIEGYFAEGYEIGSLSLGVSRNSSTTSTCEYALILSPSSTFSASSIQVILPSVAGYNMPRDVQTFNIPAGMKHFRIYRQSTEFGATYGDNQSIRIYHIEACPVTPCNEKAGTIALTGNAEDCPGTNRTLTLSGYEPGADIQWYRDGNPVSGATNPTLTTSVPGDYYAVTMNACEKRSTNSITLSDMPDPSATALLDYIYVKNGRPVQIDLFRFEGGSSWSVTPAISGCTYTEEDGVIHLSGTPVIGSNSNTTMTLTVNNSCTGSSATATLTLHLLASTAKPTLAYVVTGTKNGGWTAANSEGTALSTFLSAYYDVTVVNGYASNNEPKIKAYYSQYDVILMTDYPDTNIKPDNNTEGAGGRSYTNAIGCLIDIKPILTLETFVSKLDNWQISSDPKNTSSVRKMTVLCTAHNIFDETLFEGDNADEITILSGGTMQGFEPIYAPNYMFISTIDNGGETLVNCCERQIVVGARMILLGIQHEAMGSITDKGKKVIHNIIQYLLETDPNGLADCAIVFDDNHNTHVWSDAANWGPAHNRVPTPYQAVRILKPCTVDINNAAASSIKLNKENGHNGSITIQPNASLSVIGTIREVHGNNYITTYPVAAADLVIQANATNQGALAHGDEDGLTHATVQFYARGKNAPLSTTDWQYMGTPFSDVAHAIDHYENSWMCRWNEDTEGFGGTNWEWVTTSDPLIPFTGYALAQNSAKTFEFTGTLVPSVKKTLTLTSGGGDWKGWNLFANSWMAPINIRQFETSDFGSAEATIYLFNTGYRTIDDVSSASASETSGAGQYVAVPIASAGSMAESARYIPPMQGFYIYTSTSAAVTLDYNKLIYTSNFTNSTRPNRAPRRALQDEETQMPRVIIDVKGSRYTDRLYLFENPDLTNDFDNAWDGHKFEGDELAPQIMTRTGDLDLAVDASPSFGGKRIAFRAGEDTEYTLYFSTTVDGLRLRDLQTGAETDIIEGGHYSFTASNSTIEERFEIGDYRPTTEVPTGLEETQYGYGNDVLELSIYTTDGKLLLHRTTDFNAPIVLPQSGVYIVKLRTTAGTQVLKRIF